MNLTIICGNFLETKALTPRRISQRFYRRSKTFARFKRRKGKLEVFLTLCKAFFYISLVIEYRLLVLYLSIVYVSPSFNF